MVGPTPIHMPEVATNFGKRESEESGNKSDGEVRLHTESSKVSRRVMSSEEDQIKLSSTNLTGKLLVVPKQLIANISNTV